MNELRIGDYHIRQSGVYPNKLYVFFQSQSWATYVKIDGSSPEVFTGEWSDYLFESREQAEEAVALNTLIRAGGCS